MKKKRFNFNKLDFDNKKQIKVLSLVIVLTCIVLIGTSYAWLVVGEEGKKSVGIVTGTLDLKFDDTGSSLITLADQIPVSDDDGMKIEGYTFKIQNTGSVDSDYIVYLDDASLVAGESRISDNNIKYGLVKNGQDPSIDLVGNLMNGALIRDRILVGDTNTYTLRVWLDEENFNSEAAMKVFKKVLRVEASQKVSNANIVEAYTYTDRCITGEETACIKTNCYKEKVAGSCPAGTIIKYKVNDTETVPFHVMFDEGGTMTMQSQRNIINNTAWADDEDISDLSLYRTPLNIITELENATKNWTNVNNQTYTMGKTKFKTNAYTSCNKEGACQYNGYRLARRTAKARLIVSQEAASLGCNSSANSCPEWLANYLEGSSSSDPNAGVRYFTMSRYGDYNGACIAITNTGNLDLPSVYEQLGARAVVVINK